MSPIRVLLFVLAPVFGGCSSAGQGHDASPLAMDASNVDLLTEAGSLPSGTAGAIGNSCVDASTCPAGGSGSVTCLGGAYQGGYCAVTDCAAHGHDCPGVGTTSECVLVPAATCLRLCQTDADCRAGYICLAEPDAAGHGSYQVCIPK